jgi:hypothetical protein
MSKSEHLGAHVSEMICKGVGTPRRFDGTSLVDEEKTRFRPKEISCLDR